MPEVRTASMTLIILMAAAVAAGSSPPELGKVPWLRSYAEGLQRSRETGKPVLLLFTEVPGCSTVNDFAREVLSDPLLVDAAELFVPVAIFNNKGGDDAAALQRWKEPSWGNPVLRFLDAREQELAPRLTHEGGLAALAQRMAAALSAHGTPPPPWLTLLATPGSDTVSYAMGCFWEGEAKLGALAGVSSSRTGFEDGREVVQLWLDPAARSSVEERARALGYRAMPGRSVQPSQRDDKYHLQRSPIARLKLTEGQKMRINSALAAGEDPTPWLAPSQRQKLAAQR